MTERPVHDTNDYRCDTCQCDHCCRTRAMRFHVRRIGGDLGVSQTVVALALEEHGLMSTDRAREILGLSTEEMRSVMRAQVAGRV